MHIFVCNSNNNFTAKGKFVLKFVRMGVSLSFYGLLTNKHVKNWYVLMFQRKYIFCRMME